MSENFCVENILLGLINTNVSDIFLNSNQPLRVRKSGSIRVVEKYTLSKEDIDNFRKSVVAPALENEYIVSNSTKTRAMSCWQHQEDT